MILSTDFMVQRYSPPTCTLEIWTKRPLLSLASSGTFLSQATFKLYFDDPKRSDVEQVTLTGDRNELQQLCNVVRTYVQNLVQLSAHYLLNPQETINALGVTLATLESDHQPATESVSSLLSTLPTLKPVGLLTHELDFGSLNSDTLQSSLNLNISQLFDLANALEEYSAEEEYFPALYKAKSKKGTWLWGAIATIALLGVGISTVGVEFWPLTSQISLNKPQSSSNQSTLRDILPPVPPPPNTGTVPSPHIPPSLAQQNTLSPPTTVPPASTPPRNQQIEVIVPPTRVLPPPPNVPPAPEQTTILVTPHSPENPVPPQISRQPGNSRANPYPVLAEQRNFYQTMPNLPDLPALSNSYAPNSLTNPDLLAANTPNSSPLPNQKTINPKTSLLDTIPQVSEAREYFQQRWQPPNNLKQTLEYRLVLNSDGSIGRIMPLGGAAKIYLDRTNMPLLGESFVSAPEQKNPQIRLVLSPDGTVRTFLEQYQQNTP
jgi:hypothetical protein